MQPRLGANGVEHTTENIMSQTPVWRSVKIKRGNQVLNVGVNTISVGTKDKFRHTFTPLKTNFKEDLFSNYRLVSAGFKVHKTSKSDQESGIVYT